MHWNPRSPMKSTVPSPVDCVDVATRLADTAVIICGRDELLMETSQLLQAWVPNWVIGSHLWLICESDMGNKTH